GGRIYTFGTGHSHMLGQEIYARAGGYAAITPICEVELTTLTHPFKSTLIERTTQYLEVIKGLYPLHEHDVVIVASNSGRNPLIVEFCLWAKACGASIIAITSMQHSQSIASRHESGKRLFEVADVVLDNRANPGDASIEHTPLIQTGPTSTQMGCFLSHALISTVVEKMVQSEGDAPVFRSSNLDGSDAYNQTLFDRYIFQKETK
ncbi:MAG: SIS domain-containing protein, partial [Erysipelotrichaceae bacterium]